MGLDTSHGCWSGPYSAFHRWRRRIAEVAGLGDLDHYEGFQGTLGERALNTETKRFEESHPLTPLLSHSDCDGKIDSKDCTGIADALEALLPVLEGFAKHEQDARVRIANEWYVSKTKEFAEGLREAATAGEDVEFY